MWARQRQLHKDAVDFVTAVEIGNQCQQFFRGRRFRQACVVRCIGRLLERAFHFASDVNFRGGIVSDQHDGEDRDEHRMLPDPSPARRPQSEFPRLFLSRPESLQPSHLARFCRQSEGSSRKTVLKGDSIASPRPVLAIRLRVTIVAWMIRRSLPEYPGVPGFCSKPVIPATHGLSLNAGRRRVYPIQDESPSCSSIPRRSTQPDFRVRRLAQGGSGPRIATKFGFLPRRNDNSATLIRATCRTVMCLASLRVMISPATFCKNIGF